MKQLGAIAALKDVVAFNLEVAEQLRSVFDGFRSTEYGRTFVVGPPENFNTDELGESSFALHNSSVEQEYSLQIEIHSSGVAEIYTKFSDRVVPLTPLMSHQSVGSQVSGAASPAELAAAHIIGSILELDRSSRFGVGFHKYIGDLLAGRDPRAVPAMDFPDKTI